MTISNDFVTMTPSEIVLAFGAEIPVDVDALAEALGIQVNYSASLPENVSGKIERVGNSRSGYLITVNAKHHDRRRRFTLAHEIGHYILHRDLIGDGLTDDGMYRSTLIDGRKLDDYREQEANQYAASILMPAAVVKAKFRSNIRSFAAMAKEFDVSPEAASIRMKSLRLG